MVASDRTAVIEKIVNLVNNGLTEEAAMKSIIINGMGWYFLPENTCRKNATLCCVVDRSQCITIDDVRAAVAASKASRPSISLGGREEILLKAYGEAMSIVASMRVGQSEGAVTADEAKSGLRQFSAAARLFSEDYLAAFDDVFFPSMLEVHKNIDPGSDNTLAGTFNISRAAIGLRAMQCICHTQQRNNGWWKLNDDGSIADFNHGEKLMLIVSEIAEAMEGDRKSREDDHVKGRKNVEVELADAVCRIFDYAQAEGLDIAGALVDKLAYNATRADHKPENRAKEGGKKY